MTPVGTLLNPLADGTVEEVTTSGDGTVTDGLRRHLLDVQHGRRPDDHGWLVPVS